MSSVATEDEVVQRVLDIFQSEFRGGWFSRIFMFMLGAPTEGYARQLSELNARGRMTGSVLGVWRIIRTEIVALPASFTVPAPKGRGFMYYDRATFDFVVAPDRNSVVIGFTEGPRCGRGGRYQVVTHEDGRIALSLSEALWRS